MCEKLVKSWNAFILITRCKLNSLVSVVSKLRKTYEMGKEVAKANMEKIKFIE